ncbi:LEAF RUST 10 DISEASE-RESISTANCE LOCUS RECEPTOR-LIKE PROTEIN KINASE-like 2.7 [Salvia miltiorrhiza]|uniref:LEAF RUST 10 DISEASE-RESISTANCE LOCUS RECEPTOR-LIKE PROTEIN KINASE-like 2.7 n=1 Tax=Salvia miltiorrhiza TaxID=226208 RepID=UPI0025AD065A|nr:LEAF RUST 10 DISEASE-RESISTANCE LOCUS RECEPTOR-LIKE PROTEIN KINASE-like 2.7 [Salvia miltiorrhiza]
MSNTALVILLLFLAESCRAKNSSLCTTSSCGNINISYPFRLRGDPADCGHPDSFYALECQKNRLILHTESRRYHVEAITYSNFSIRISDPGLDSNNISSCPIYSYINNDIYSNYVYTYYTSSIYITFINCLSPVANPLYVENPFCGNTSAFSNDSRIYSYVTTESILIPDLEESCTYDTMAQASLIWPSTDHHNYSYAQIHDLLAYGFELLWYPALCTECNESKGTCSLEGNKIRCRHYCYESTPFEDRTFICKLEYYAVYLYLAALAIGGLIALRFVIGIPCIIGMVVVGVKRQRSWMNNSENMEELMRHQLNHMPINYSYREIKKMTQNFKAKLGGGPHGSVFRGKLRSGPIVAVKMLSSSSSASDKEFIRRASEISRIANPNVVKLFGFCIKGKKRGVVHEFVQCGSLDRHIKEGGLSCGETFKISIGIARGIQCLHAANILHLAIKPQNILLDEYLSPKISVERFESSQFKGKMGFMAPEMFYSNIGGEADVYSFGMLVLEMAARLQGELGREVYFPLWVYKQLCEGKELEMRDGGEEEKEMMKKMIVAGLWCIQIKAGDRPTMEQVVAMLQGGLELLHLPPMPFHHSHLSFSDLT